MTEKKKEKNELLNASITVIFMIFGAIAVFSVCAWIGANIFWAVQPDQSTARSSYDYQTFKVEQFTVTATGTAGSAAGTKASDGVIRGHIYAMHLDFNTPISLTTDLTVTTNTAPSLTLLTLTNNMTDTWLYPAVQQTGNTGSGTSTYDRMPVNDNLLATIAQSTATDVVTVTVYWGE